MFAQLFLLPGSCNKFQLINHITYNRWILLVIDGFTRMALEAAERKVDELRRSKVLSVDTPTIAQTVNKVSGRVAHVPMSINDIDQSKLAPPVLEPSASKISCNIRTQYYNIMVKHCLKIYSQPTDAYDRAQTEEISVFRKCSTPNIYKSSALLTINHMDIICFEF